MILVGMIIIVPNPADPRSAIIASRWTRAMEVDPILS